MVHPTSHKTVGGLLRPNSDWWRYFSSDYVTARQRFLDAAESAGAIVTTLPLEVRGPYEEALSIDIAYLGPQDASELLIHTSGVHGVEGYPGSAVQIRLLERFAGGEIQLPDGVGVVVAHAINPFGMAWGRRVNEDNADLNRNFLPAGEAYIGEPERYHEIDSLLNPRSHRTPFDFFVIKAAWVLFRMGFSVAKQTIAEGQYERPKGMQYGGHRLCRGSELWLGFLNTRLVGVRRAVWLDFHTGLGPYGVDSLLISGDDSPKALSRLRSHYGETVQSNDPEQGVAYHIRGGMMDGVMSRWPRVKWTAITQEFGTVKPVKVIAALRAENRMTQWSDESVHRMFESPERRRLLRTFNPDCERWRGMIMGRGQELIDDALKDLTRD